MFVWRERGEERERGESDLWLTSKGVERDDRKRMVRLRREPFLDLLRIPEV